MTVKDKKLLLPLAIHALPVRRLVAGSPFSLRLSVSNGNIKSCTTWKLRSFRRIQNFGCCVGSIDLGRARGQWRQTDFHALTEPLEGRRRAPLRAQCGDHRKEQEDSEEY